jgi:hypothetical protein
MKAEHRKELQTNTLADYLGRGVDSLKNGPTLTVVLVVAVLLLGGWWMWSFFSTSSRSSDALLWTKLDQAKDDEQLEQLAEANPGTTQARTARFEIARTMIQRGSEKIGNPAQHAEAIKDLVKARQLFQELAPLCRAEPILQQEAMMGLAKAEESLIGAPDPNEAKQTLGSIDRAIGYYEEVATKFPESFQGKAARQRAKELKENRKDIESFYAVLNQQGLKK